jgi:hypothetical protein
MTAEEYDRAINAMAVLVVASRAEDLTTDDKPEAA